MKTACKLCGSNEILPYFSTGTFSVSGDSKILPYPVEVLFCSTCANFFKVRTAGDLEIIDSINNQRTLYGSQHAPEQRVAYDKYQGGIPRSRYQLDYLCRILDLPSEGAILDVGCQCGLFLKSFHERFPFWELVGLDVAPHYEEFVKNISNRARYVFTNPDSIEQKFDLITLSHVLEHVAEPEAVLRFSLSHLKPGGRLYLHTVNALDNPFSAVIFDHFQDFTSEGLRRFTNGLALEILDLDTEYLPKEISLIAQYSADREQTRTHTGADSELKRQVFAGRELLIETQRCVESIRNNSRGIGVLGTSVPGTWIGGLLGDSLGFYVDENPNKRGQRHLGVPIKSPADLDASDSVLIALTPPVASKIKERLSSNFKGNFVIPPFSGSVD